MKFWPLLLAASKAAWAANSTPVELSLRLDPRIDYIQGSESTQAERGLLKARGQLRAGRLQLVAEGFGDYDLAPDQPVNRRDDNTLALQEAYAEFRFTNVLARIGRQPLRWSESWSLPSLDVWTGRRWNRLFFDPVDIQLTHPTGALIAVGDSDTQIEGFANFLPAANFYPAPLPYKVETEHTEWGFRAKKRLKGFDLTAIAAQLEDHFVGGGSASYAFDQVVPRMEGGGTNDDQAFGTAGLSIFVEQWSFLPQATALHTNTGFDHDQLQGYLPIRWSNDQHSIEVQALYNFTNQERFFSGLYRYSFQSIPLELSVYGQNYAGTSGTLFGIYQNLTRDFVIGLRMEAHGVF